MKTSSVDFAHPVCKRFGRLQRTEISNDRALELRAYRYDLIALRPGGCDFVFDHAANHGIRRPTTRLLASSARR